MISNIFLKSLALLSTAKAAFSGAVLSILSKGAAVLATAKAAVSAKALSFIASLDIGQYLNPDTCPDYVKNSKLGSTAVALLDYTSFLQSGVKALKVVIIAVGGGLAVLGVVNLLEGYGNDNPGAKSQGMKQLMAGGGVALIGTTLVPLLAGLF